MAEQQHTEITTTETVHEEQKSSLLTDILTIIGFAILFIIIIWGLIHLLGLISSSFSPSKPVATIQVSAPAQATSGESVSISWNYAPATTGTYAFLYQCESGLTFQTSSAKDSGIPCGVAYTIGNASSSISVIPMFAGTSSVNDTLSVVFIPSKTGSQVQGDATMTVNAVQKQQPAPKPVATQKSSGAGSGSSYSYTSTYNSGPADISVHIVSSSIDQSGAGVVTFDIGNIGGSTSGSYTFSALLPTSPAIPYNSAPQAPLAPGSHIVDTLRFTDVAAGGGIFSVSVYANDADQANNYASTQVSAPYNNGYNTYPVQQPYTQYPNYNY